MKKDIDTNNLINIFRYRLNALYGEFGQGVDIFEKFFDTYEMISWVQTSREKNILKDTIENTCRFCNNSNLSKEDFSGNAHLISQLFGRPNLTSNFECNNCNEHFGQMETDLGNWSSVDRAILGQKTKKKKFAKYQQGGIIIERINEAEEIVKKFPDISKEQAQNMEVVYHKSKSSFNSKEELKLDVKVPGYIPENVYKSFLKFFIGCIPESNLPEIKDLTKWVRYDELQKNLEVNLFKIFTYRFKAIKDYFKTPTVWIFKRKHKLNKEQEYFDPMYTMLFFTGNKIYQIYVPLVLGDIEQGKTIKKFRLLLYPYIMNPNNIKCFCKDSLCVTTFDSAKIDGEELKGKEKIKDSRINMTFFDSKNEYSS